jgi:hypothetical protein
MMAARTCLFVAPSTRTCLGLAAGPSGLGLALCSPRSLANSLYVCSSSGQDFKAARGSQQLSLHKCLHSSMCACHPCTWGHANILCVVPSLTDGPRRESEPAALYHRLTGAGALAPGQLEDPAKTSAALRAATPNPESKKAVFRSQPLNFLKLEPWDTKNICFGPPNPWEKSCVPDFVIRIGGYKSRRKAYRLFAAG